MTSQILFDRLAYVDRLKAGSFSEQQARAAADALGEALTETVATKADVAQLETTISRLETKMETRFSALDVRFANLDTRFAALDSRFSTIDAHIAESRASVIQWVVGVAIAACTIGAAVASFIFKHTP
jgi:hypothetical protein